MSQGRQNHKIGLTELNPNQTQRPDGLYVILSVRIIATKRVKRVND
jgi:hypothetical protein